MSQYGRLSNYLKLKEYYACFKVEQVASAVVILITWRKLAKLRFCSLLLWHFYSSQIDYRYIRLAFLYKQKLPAS